jgi:hypothetical protein
MAGDRDIRDEAKRLIDQLPVGARWEDLAYEVSDADAGRTSDHETALARVRQQSRQPE